jgi:ribosomal protein S12 methylthiotransferase
LKKDRINIVTLGCSKNKVDSEHLAALIPTETYSLTHDGEQESEIVVINTCGFIGDAKEESIDMILTFAEARKRGEVKQLYVMGCLSQRYKKSLQAEIHEVDAFFGVDQIDEVAAAILQRKTEKIPAHYQRSLSTPDHYAYLKISEGCDRSCSFCAIPLIRGKHISVPKEILLKETQLLADKGVKELILIAQDLTYYGIDLSGKREITNLIEALSQVDGIEWIRIQYTYPAGFPKDLISLMVNNPKVCNYIDMPLQHINDQLLKSMKRGLDGAKTRDLVRSLRNEIPDLSFRTAFIVGYPGETDEMFEELCDFVSEMKFERLGVFTYSAEEDTAAYDLGDIVPEAVKQERMERLMEIQQSISLEINAKKIGKTLKVLVDRLENGFYVGRTQYDSPEVDNEVLIDATKALEVNIGNFYNAKITEADFFDLYAEIE